MKMFQNFLNVLIILKPNNSFYIRLSVTLTSERGVNEVKIVADPYKPSFINYYAASTFVDQQKWQVDLSAIFQIPNSFEH